MKKEYKGHSKKSGVYKITNTINGKIYIGSAKCFQVRASQHISSLKNNKHSNKHLQASFNKHGTDAFLFEVIEVVPGDKTARTSREQVYVDEQKENWQNCYNIAKETISKEGPWSFTPEETRKKHSERLKRIWQDPEHRRKISKANSAAAKRQWSDEKSREKLVKGIQKACKSRRGISWGSHTEEHKRHMSKVMQGNDWNKGKKKAPEVAEVLRRNLDKYKNLPKRLANLRKALSKRVKVWKIGDPSSVKICSSIVAAAKATGLSRTTIRRNLQGKQRTRSSWKFAWADQPKHDL